MKYVSNSESLEYSLLTTQRALVDMVTSQMRAVVVRIDEEKRMFYLYYYYDGEVDEDLIDLWQCSTCEATIDTNFFTEVHITRLDYPEKIPLNGGNFAYLRKEDLYYPSKGKKVFYDTFIYGAPKLAILSALLGNVTPELRAVIVDTQVEKKNVCIIFYHDGELKEEIRNLWEGVIQEVRHTLKDFNPTVEGKIERVDYTGERFRGNRGTYVYHRKED